MKNIETGKLFGIILVLIVVISPYFIINHYFDKKKQFRAFEECVAVVSNPIANWDARKITVSYCWDQSR